VGNPLGLRPCGQFPGFGEWEIFFVLGLSRQKSTEGAAQVLAWFRRLFVERLSFPLYRFANKQPQHVECGGRRTPLPASGTRRCATRGRRRG